MRAGSDGDDGPQTSAPHSPQNFTIGLNALPQRKQIRTRPVPQYLQNLSSSRFSARNLCSAYRLAIHRAHSRTIRGSFHACIKLDLMAAFHAAAFDRPDAEPGTTLRSEALPRSRS